MRRAAWRRLRRPPRTPSPTPHGPPTGWLEPRRAPPSWSGSSDAAGRPAFFSRSLAALGHDDPERRRARLYAVIETVIADEPQGFSLDDANIRRLCALAEVSRSGYYRRHGPHAPAGEDADLRDLIQRIALADRHYGCRRVARELRRQGLVVNHKRVARLMREDNLLALRAKPFVPRTTMRKHDCPVAKPNALGTLGHPPDPADPATGQDIG